MERRQNPGDQRAVKPLGQNEGTGKRKTMLDKHFKKNQT